MTTRRDAVFKLAQGAMAFAAIAAVAGCAGVPGIPGMTDTSTLMKEGEDLYQIGRAHV